MRFWEETNKVGGTKKAGPFATGSGSPKTLNNSVKIFGISLCISNEDSHLLVIAFLTRLLKMWTLQLFRICWASFTSNIEIPCCKRDHVYHVRSDIIKEALARAHPFHDSIETSSRPAVPNPSPHSGGTSCLWNRVKTTTISRIVL